LSRSGARLAVPQDAVLGEAARCALRVERRQGVQERMQVLVASLVSVAEPGAFPWDSPLRVATGEGVGERPIYS
jgi:hypothetical protein